MNYPKPPRTPKPPLGFDDILAISLAPPAIQFPDLAAALVAQQRQIDLAEQGVERQEGKRWWQKAQRKLKQEQSRMDWLLTLDEAGFLRHQANGNWPDELKDEAGA